LMFRLQLGVLS